MQMEATCSSETSVDFRQTTQRYIPEGRSLHNHHCENLKSYRGKFYFYLFRLCSADRISVGRLDGKSVRLFRLSGSTICATFQNNLSVVWERDGWTECGRSIQGRSPVFYSRKYKHGYSYVSSPELEHSDAQNVKFHSSLHMQCNSARGH
jgi:hypothetical protein